LRSGLWSTRPLTPASHYQNMYIRKCKEGLKTAVTCRVLHVQITVKKTSIQALSSISYIFFGRQAWIKSLWVTSTCWRPSSTILTFRTGASKSRGILQFGKYYISVNQEKNLTIGKWNILKRKFCNYNKLELHVWMKVIEFTGKWALSMLKWRYLVWKNEENAAKFSIPY
jgi:hypothetical protein